MITPPGEQRRIAASHKYRVCYLPPIPDGTRVQAGSSWVPETPATRRGQFAHRMCLN